MNHECSTIDFSPLLVPGVKFAVRCESEEEAMKFVNAMIDQFPDKCRYWSKYDPMWWNDNEGEEGGRAYFPNVNDEEFDEVTEAPENLTQGSVRYADDNDFTIILFSSLIVEELPLSESDMSIEEFFGM